MNTVLLGRSPGFTAPASTPPSTLMQTSWLLILHCCFNLENTNSSASLFTWYPTNSEWGQPERSQVKSVVFVWLNITALPQRALQSVQHTTPSVLGPSQWMRNNFPQTTRRTSWKEPQRERAAQRYCEAEGAAGGLVIAAPTDWLHANYMLIVLSLNCTNCFTCFHDCRWLSETNRAD